MHSPSFFLPPVQSGHNGTSIGFLHLVQADDADMLESGELFLACRVQIRLSLESANLAVRNTRPNRSVSKIDKVEVVLKELLPV